MEADEKRALVFELIDVVIQSWWTLVAAVCFGVAGAAVALHYIPKYYQAKAELLVIPQQIPTDFVRTTVTEDMTRRVAALGEYVFDESNMVDLVERHFGPGLTEGQQLGLIRSVRSGIEIGQNPRTGIMSLAYTDMNPKRASDLANDLADLYVRESSRFRRAQVHDTKENIATRVDEYKAELDAKQRELNDFLQRHYAETSGSYQANMHQLESSRSDLETNLARQKDLREQLPALQARLRDARAAGTETELAVVDSNDPWAAQLRKLNAELESLLIVYQEAHPNVQKKKREIEDLKRRMPPPTTTDPAPAGEPPLSPLAAEVQSMEKQLGKLETQEVKLRSEIATLNARIAATPRVQTELDQLTAERDLLSNKYLEFQTKLETAEDAQSLEESENAQQIKVVKSARVPDRPIRPQPQQVYLVGLALGLLLFVGPLPLKRILNPLVASEAGIKNIAGVPLLVTIPRIITNEARGFAFRKLAKNLSLSVLSTAVCVAVYYFIIGTGG